MTTSDQARSPARARSPWTPLRHRVFLALFVAQLASNVGTLMQNVGSAWLMGDLGSHISVTKAVIELDAIEEPHAPIEQDHVARV